MKRNLKKRFSVGRGTREGTKGRVSQRSGVRITEILHTFRMQNENKRKIETEVENKPKAVKLNCVSTWKGHIQK